MSREWGSYFTIKSITFNDACFVGCYLYFLFVMSIKILTLNCNGALNNDNKYILKECFTLNNINIAFLQETHIANKTDKENIEELFNCKSFWSFGTNNARGVGILIFEKF